MSGAHPENGSFLAEGTRGCPEPLFACRLRAVWIASRHRSGLNQGIKAGTAKKQSCAMLISRSLSESDEAARSHWHVPKSSLYYR